MEHRNDVLSQGLAYAESSASHNTILSASIYPLIGVMPHESHALPHFLSSLKMFPVYLRPPYKQKCFFAFALLGWYNHERGVLV